MSGFLFAFLATLIASFGGRDQALLAQLTTAQGQRPLLLVTALVSAVATTALAVWAASHLLAEMNPPARPLFAAIALVLAGGEMLLLSPGKAAAEPTHSLFAALVVLAAIQITDAARFLVLALGVGAAAPVPAGLGGALGSAAMLTLGWWAPQLAGMPRWRLVRRGAGGLFLLIGLAIGVRPFIG